MCKFIWVVWTVVRFRFCRSVCVVIGFGSFLVVVFIGDIVNRLEILVVFIICGIWEEVREMVINFILKVFKLFFTLLSSFLIVYFYCFYCWKGLGISWS